MMNTAQHTPGPWEAVATVSSDRKHIFGRAKNNEYYVGTLTSGSREDLVIFKANTRLIAAAPELLEALETACNELEVYQMSYKDDESANATLDIVRAAIATAKEMVSNKPTCAERAQWAEKAVSAYAHAKEGREYDPVADMAPDLSTDLCHLLVGEGILPDLILERAKIHYEEECAEEGIVI